jgi:hypothetical protein
MKICQISEKYNCNGKVVFLINSHTIKLICDKKKFFGPQPKDRVTAVQITFKFIFVHKLNVK